MCARCWQDMQARAHWCVAVLLLLVRRRRRLMCGGQGCWTDTGPPLCRPMQTALEQERAIFDQGAASMQQ